MVESDHRSIHPNIPGVPWWAAVLIATLATAIGYVLDAGLGHQQLTNTFASCYVVGCLAATLAVRQSGLFTAVIQPPLILFCAVPAAYWLFHEGHVSNLKDLLINCGYPLIERFPLMVGTAGGVLLIGLVRWYFGLTYRSVSIAQGATATATERTSVMNSLKGLGAKLASFFDCDPDRRADEAPNTNPPPSVSRSPRTARPTRNSRTTKQTTRTPSRHARSSTDTPRRQTRAHDFDATDPHRRPRRRSHPQSDPDPRTQPPRDTRREPRARLNPYQRPYEQPAPRSSRFDPYDLFGASAEPLSRYERYRAQPHEQQRRRTMSPGPASANPTHQSTSRGHYRGQFPSGEPRTGRGLPRPHQAESWE